MKKIGIITAMKEEADLIIEKYNLELLNTKGTLTVFSGDYSGVNIILVLGGIGKIQSSYATTYLLENYGIDFLINIGIAGNISKNIVNIGDVILPSSFVQHDIYLPFPGEHLNYAKAEIKIFNNLKMENSFSFKVHNNLKCLTGDQFIDDEVSINKLIETHNGNLVEMEAYSILSVAKNYNFLDKTIVIKGISDGANNEAIDAHMSNLEIAMQNSIIILDKITLQIK